MNNFNFGDIVLLEFPFSSGGIIKKRPALIIKNTSDDDVIVCRITSQPYYSEYDVQVNQWQQCGLKLPSTIRVHKLATIEKCPTIRMLGKIDERTKTMVKTVFANFLK